jgi:hypothetical protein
MTTTNLRWVTYAHHANFFERIVSGDLVDTVLPRDSVKAWCEANRIKFWDHPLHDRIAYSVDLTEDEAQRFRDSFG